MKIPIKLKHAVKVSFYLAISKFATAVLKRCRDRSRLFRLALLVSLQDR
jgi:hypothetical protein